MSPSFRRVMSVLLLSLILVTVVGCKLATSGKTAEATPTPIPPPPVPEKPTYTVKLGLVVDSLSFTGRVSPTIEKELFFRESGRAKKVYVDRNAMVTEGQLLAELENDDLARQLSQAQLQLDAATITFKSAQEARDYAIQRAMISLEMKRWELTKTVAVDRATVVGPTQADIAIARANVQRAEASLKLAQARYDQRASRPGYEASFEALALEQATLDMQIAQANYNRLFQNPKTSTLQYDIESLKLQIKLAEMDLGQLQKGVDPQLTKAVETAKLAMERLKAQYDNTRVVSSIAGKVTSVSVYEGRPVEAYKAAFVVADETKIEITAEPASGVLDKLTEGMEAAIILSAYPGKELKGKIYLLPYPYGSGGGSTDSTSGAAGQDKLTHIEFDPQDLKLQTGDLVKVLVTLQKKDDALWLPPAAIRTFAGRKFVVVEEEGWQRRVDITVGIESAERVEIKEGLQENQIVVGQ